MKKPIWSADSRAWFLLASIYSVVGSVYGVELILSPSWLSVVCGFAMLWMAVYLLAKFFEALRLEKLVGERISELGFRKRLDGVTPKVGAGEFFGFDLEGVAYPVKTTETTYSVETFLVGGTKIVLYRYSFPKWYKDFLVVFDKDEPPTKGGVTVFGR